MPNNIRIWPYNMGSRSAKLLARAVDGLRVRTDGIYRPRRRHIVINWGNSGNSRWLQRAARILNHPTRVQQAADKVYTFVRLAQNQVAIPDMTTSRDVARQWLQEPAKFAGKLHAVVCRTLTRASQGRGIVLARTPLELVPAPLYTRYTPKEAEFRVHVMRGTIIDVQMKRRRNGFNENNPLSRYIRNHQFGWVFCRNDVAVPEVVKDLARRAVSALQLDFGAVDIGYHATYGSVVYEVNTAPGLEGQTLESYKNACLQL